MAGWVDVCVRVRACGIIQARRGEAVALLQPFLVCAPFYTVGPFPQSLCTHTPKWLEPKYIHLLRQNPEPPPAVQLAMQQCCVRPGGRRGSLQLSGQARCVRRSGSFLLKRQPY